MFFSDLWGTTPTKIRIWMWHGNGTGSTLYFSAYLSLADTTTGATYKATNIKYSYVKGANLDVMGRCLAKIQLSKAFEQSHSDVTLATYETSMVEESVTAGTDNTLGVCYECDITASQTVTLRF